MIFGNFQRDLIITLLVSNVQYLTVLCSVKTVNFYGDTTLNGQICLDLEVIVQVSSRSKISCTQICADSSSCACVFYNKVTMICTLCTGRNNLGPQGGTLFYAKPNSPFQTHVIDGKQFKIYAKANNEFWHYNGGGTHRIVSSLAQPNDNYVRFIFEKQEDGSYKIKSTAKPLHYMYDGYNALGSSYQSLYGMDDSDDRHMRYFVTMLPEGYCRIQTMATGRYVRLDEDQHVTSMLNKIDDRSLFKLVEA